MVYSTSTRNNFSDYVTLRLKKLIGRRPFFSSGIQRNHPTFLGKSCAKKSVKTSYKPLKMQSLQVNILDIFYAIKHLPAEEKVRIMEHLLGVAKPPPSMPSSFIPQLPPSPPNEEEEIVEAPVILPVVEVEVKEEIEIVEVPIVPQVIVVVPVDAAVELEPPTLPPAKPKRELNWWVKGYSFVIQRMKAMNPNHPAFKENYFNMDVAILLREKGYLSETSMPTDDQIQEAFQARHADPDTIQHCLQMRTEKKAARTKKAKKDDDDETVAE
jgi:hypothetical protein